MAIVVTILNADKSLSFLETTLKTVSKSSIEKISKKLPVKNLDIMYYAAKAGTIKGLGIGGYTFTDSLIQIPIDPTFPTIEGSIKNNLPNTLAHEIYHAARGYSGETPSILLNSMINEGLADHFGLEVYGGKPNAWDCVLTEDKIKSFLKKSKEGDNPHYDHNAWFFGSKEKGIPHWTGYSLGFYLVGKYLSKTGKKPSELLKIKAKEFI